MEPLAPTKQLRVTRSRWTKLSYAGALALHILSARTLLDVKRLLTQNPRIKDNLQIADKGSCTNLSVIGRFHCNHGRRIESYRRQTRHEPHCNTHAHAHKLETQYIDVYSRKASATRQCPERSQDCTGPWEPHRDWSGQYRQGYRLRTEGGQWRS